MNFAGALRLRGDPFGADWFENDVLRSQTRLHDVALASGLLPVFYPKGGMFFLEGQVPTGVFFLHTGRAKEFMVSNAGRTTIVRLPGPGAILGLTAVLSGAPHESTVETLESTQAGFIRKAAFLHLLKTSSRLNQVVADQLIRNCQEAYVAVRCLGVSNSVSERFARLLLQWAESPLQNQKKGSAGIRIRVTLTHEEIGQAVGSTRETMCRILAEFREKKWITTKGSTWTIANKDALRRLAAL